MTFGQLRMCGTVPPSFPTNWKRVHGAWRRQWKTLRSFTWGIDAPELYTERSFVGQWATALTRSFPKAGLSVVERPVMKSNASGNGFLDLWLAIQQGQDEFDYAIETKPLVLKSLKAKRAAAICYRTAEAERRAMCSMPSTQISRFSAGAALGILSYHTRLTPWTKPQLDSFESDLWNDIQGRVSRNPLIDHAVLATCVFPSGHFSHWNSRAPRGAFALFLATDTHNQGQQTPSA